MTKEYDYIILGAGIYGLYSAKLLIDKGYKVAVLEYDDASFRRASYINQARVHKGYHYPRSYATAIKSANYFKRFNSDFKFAINNKFKKIYGIAKNYSYLDSEQFVRFCNNANLECEKVDVQKYFNKYEVESAYLTEEYVFDANRIKQWFLEYLRYSNGFDIFYNVRLESIEEFQSKYKIITQDDTFYTNYIINATYASVNQILDRMQMKKYPLKYEISEIILCSINNEYKDIGLTLMDGPFISLMPFGLGELHSLTSVIFTHHKTSLSSLPTFECQKKNNACTPMQLENCNKCKYKPSSQWDNMNQLVKKYFINDIKLEYVKSLFAIKPIMQNSKLDDGRPTIIKVHNKQPGFISILSGKINTIYDLEGVIT